MMRDLSRALPGRGLPLVLLLATVAAFGALLNPLVGVGLAVAALAATITRHRDIRSLAVAGVVITAVAALVGPNLAVPGAPWLFAFRVLIGVLGVGTAAYVLSGGAIPRLSGLGRPAGLICVWIVWSALSLGWAIDTTAAARWTLFLAMMGGLAVGIPLAASTPKRAVRLLIVLGVAFSFAVAIAMAELALGVRLPTSALLGRDRAVAFGATSLFGNQNNFATYLTLSLPYFVAIPIVVRDIRLRMIGFVGTAIALGALLYTGSKSNLIALALIFVALILVIASDRRRRGRLVVAGAFVVVVAAIIVPSVLGGGLVKLPDRAVEKFNFGLLRSQVNSGSGSGGVRSSLLTDGLDLVARSGGLGVGAGNAEANVRSLNNFPGVANLHNWWLEVLVNGGVVGFAIWLAIYAYLVRWCIGAARRGATPLVRYLGLAGALSLAGFVAGALGPSTAIHFAPMWITLGLCMTAVVLHRRGRA